MLCKLGRDCCEAEEDTGDRRLLRPDTVTAIQCPLVFPQN